MLELKIKMKKAAFILNFFKSWREVGSITPSSSFLTKRILAEIDFKKSSTIVELGPGSGPFTKEIIKRMSPNSKLIMFETNTDFYKELIKVRDPRVVIHNESALQMQNYLSGERVDYIVSGIPLSNLEVSHQKGLLRSIYSALLPKGRYLQFQYSLGAYKMIEGIFNDVSLRFVPLNIPPAFVYSCSKGPIAIKIN